MHHNVAFAELQCLDRRERRQCSEQTHVSHYSPPLPESVSSEEMSSYAGSFSPLFGSCGNNGRSTAPRLAVNVVLNTSGSRSSWTKSLQLSCTLSRLDNARVQY